MTLPGDSWRQEDTEPSVIIELAPCQTSQSPYQGTRYRKEALGAEVVLSGCAKGQQQARVERSYMRVVEQICRESRVACFRLERAEGWDIKES